MNSEITLHNTLTGQNEIFTPLKEGVVGMYHCGPTVYHYAHIGNLRSYILADSLRRMFEANQYQVNQVINITDVGHLTGDNLGDANTGEDRMEKAAKSTGKTAQEITAFYTAAFMKDLARLHINIHATQFPKPSEHIPEQIKLIQELEAKDAIYKTSDGMYFDTSKFEHYGKLGNINIEGLKEGARVEGTGEKRNATDFAVWKFSPQDESRQQEWESPWGKGFPGWHIECSAMAMKYLGQTFDVHTGGIDHIPVHHNNEIAQSELATGKPFAHYWLHNAFVNVNDGKIGKSLGTAITLDEVIEKGFEPLDYRYFVLGARYNQPINFTIEAITGAKNARRNLVAHVAQIISANKSGSIVGTAVDENMIALMNNNLDTPNVLAHLWSVLKDVEIGNDQKIEAIKSADMLLGLNLLEEAQQLNAAQDNIEIPSNIISLAKERQLARQQKDFAKSDELRALIDKEGYRLIDDEAGYKILKKTE